MISWLQTHLQKHSRILFIVLLGVIIVAFVFTIGAPGIGDGRGERMANLKFFDIELDTEEKRNGFFDKAIISIRINNNYYAQQDVQGYAFNRATALHLANEHGIPGPSDEQLRDFIQELPAFQNAEGNFDATLYTAFLDQIDTNSSQSRSDISAVIVEEYRISKIQAALSGPSFVDSEEVLESIKEEKTQWTIKVAEFDLDSFNPEIEMSEEDLEEYYDENSFNYTTPARRNVSYVEFKASELQSEVVVDEAELLTYFETNATNYEVEIPIPEANAGETDQPTTELPDFEVVREQVTFDYKIEKARELSQESAQNLVLGLIDIDATYKGEDFTKVLAQYGATTQTLPPFSATETPIGTSWSREVSTAAFRLTQSRYYSDPIVQGDSTIVLFFDNEIPETTPELESVSERVIADYNKAAIKRLQNERGGELKEDLAEATSNPDEFQSAAEDLSLTVKDYADFTLASPAEGMDRSLTYSMSTLNAGDVSEMITRGNKGSFIYVASKVAPEVAATGEEYEERIKTMKTIYERYIVNQYIGDLMNKELVRSGIATNNS